MYLKKLILYLFLICSLISSIKSQGYLNESNNSNTTILVILMNFICNKVNNTDWTILHRACHQNMLNTIKTLLQNGEDLNAINNLGQTALHIASINGYKEVVEILLQGDININHKDNTGMTALRYASINGHKQIEMKLLQSGASIESKHNYYYISNAYCFY